MNAETFTMRQLSVEVGLPLVFLLVSAPVLTIAASAAARQRRASEPAGPPRGCCEPTSTMYVTSDDGNNKGVWYYDAYELRLASTNDKRDLLAVDNGRQSFSVNLTAGCTTWETPSDGNLATFHCLTDDWEYLGIRDIRVPGGNTKPFAVYSYNQGSFYVEHYYAPDDQTCVISGLQMIATCCGTETYFVEKVDFSPLPDGLFTRPPECPRVDSDNQKNEDTKKAAIKHFDQYKDEDFDYFF